MWKIFWFSQTVIVFILQGLQWHDFHNKTDVLIFRKILSIKKDKKYSTK